MESPSRERTCDLTAVLVAPDRELAGQFKETLEVSKAFQILADLKAYPSQHALEIRLRQMRPDLVLIDLASHRDSAADLIRFLANGSTPVQIVGLSPSNDPGVLLNCLRLGASEFLYAPFEISTQLEAVSRLRRLRKSDTPYTPSLGNVTVFSSSKPGSGSSTVAFHAAIALKRSSRKRVLLADFDLAGGSAGLYSEPGKAESLFDSEHDPADLTPARWASHVVNCNGVDILRAPAEPLTDRVSTTALNAILEFARANYDWVLLDVPRIFDPWSLAVISQADRALLLCTPELPNLHLARKAVRYLHRLGFPPERFQVVVNRVNRRDEIAPAQLDRLFECPVHSRLPNDFFALNQLSGLGAPLDDVSELGQAVQRMAAQLSGAPSFAPTGGPAPRVRV